MSDIQIRPDSIAYHRNGVCGNGFHVVLFTARVQGCQDDAATKHRFIATVFPERGNVTVIDLDLAHAGNVRFAENSWRGDHFESQLRQAIEADRAS